MMDIDHDTLVAFSKSWGLFYLIAFAIGVCVYTFWPSNRKRFHEAKNKILDRDDVAAIEEIDPVSGHVTTDTVERKRA
jgi:cytochrome c oxidase cbb3-type subunit 4